MFVEVVRCAGPCRLFGDGGSVLTSAIVGDVSVDGLPGEWKVEASRSELAPGLEQVSVRLTSDQERNPPRFRVSFSHPMGDCVGLWRTGAGLYKCITQKWKGESDRRDVFYAEAVRGAFDWCVRELGHDPTVPVEKSAYDPLYSTWYAYQQDVHAETVERECAEAVKFGMKTVNVDDGWQTDHNVGDYSYCGD